MVGRQESGHWGPGALSIGKNTGPPAAYRARPHSHSPRASTQPDASNKPDHFGTAPAPSTQPEPRRGERAATSNREAPDSPLSARGCTARPGGSLHNPPGLQRPWGWGGPGGGTRWEHRLPPTRATPGLAALLLHHRPPKYPSPHHRPPRGTPSPAHLRPTRASPDSPRLRKDNWVWAVLRTWSGAQVDPMKELGRRREGVGGAGFWPLGFSGSWGSQCCGETNMVSSSEAWLRRESGAGIIWNGSWFGDRRDGRDAEPACGRRVWASPLVVDVEE
ncbi:unnamed protein product [Rangifer tarandus platyrhynchus]|uniref:Uncharacterized protein n=1 Tax=Rangifer tarandus platyrhynchus TaxID=3082113 RepID=A0ABN8ZD04_RANTA|nr:unnamed protein product [Rangifer tarandus platyrhynchus]CAI9688490.1 unnamed protein product [Rangifer tarandus platyrhynchus]